MTDPGKDEELEAFLRKRTVLPDGVSVDDELQPPGALDELVLKRARDALRAQPAIHTQPRSPKSPRWAVPVALAATLLLCLSIAMNVSLNTRRPSQSLQLRTAPTANNANTTLSAAHSREAAVPEAKVAGSSAPPAPAADAGLPPPVSAASAARAANATPMPRIANAAPSVSAADAAPTSARSAPQSPAAQSLAESAERKAETAPAAAHPRDPKLWLQQIDTLRAEGKTAEADAEMRLFREAFPALVRKPLPAVPSETPK